jgi:hypothetical protein
MDGREQNHRASVLQNINQRFFHERLEGISVKIQAI